MPEEAGVGLVCLPPILVISVTSVMFNHTLTFSLPITDHSGPMHDELPSLPCLSLPLAAAAAAEVTVVKLSPSASTHDPLDYKECKEWKVRERGK